MKAAKWIGGVLGFMAFGPLGALAGYALGRAFDKSFDTEKIEDRHKDYGGRNTAGHVNVDEGQRNSFLFSMLVLASYIIKADGKVMHSEMEYVRNFLRRNFGAEAALEGDNILKNLFQRRKEMDAVNPDAFKNTIRECGKQIADNMSYEARLQLLEFLVEIVKADGNIASEEVRALKEIAAIIYLTADEVDSLLGLGGDSLEDAYKVLEVSPSATDDEVRAAYRRQALKHHPDKVAALGEDVRLAAEKKFQDINHAKEVIFKARNIK